MKKSHRPPAIREARRKQVVALTAQGMSQNEVAAALNVSYATAHGDRYKPKSQEELKNLRSEIKDIILARTQAGLIQGTMGVVAQAIREGDAKSLELSTRAAVNLDKLTASASGEMQRVEVLGIPPVTNVDLKVLITDLLGHAKRLRA